MEHPKTQQRSDGVAGVAEELERAEQGDDEARLAALEGLSESIEAELEEIDQASPPGR
ncbi:MAG: hypothetical protein M3391_10450 [Actinomycetota bacterium]|nr:hypothetical protein [Actinomycetota bacterium]